MSVGPLLVALSWGLVALGMAYSLRWRLPIWWRMRHDPDALGDLRTIQITTTSVLLVFALYQTVVWVDVALGWPPFLGTQRERWPLDAVVVALGLCALAATIVVRRRRKRRRAEAAAKVEDANQRYDALLQQRLTRKREFEQEQDAAAKDTGEDPCLK